MKNKLTTAGIFLYDHNDMVVRWLFFILLISSFLTHWGRVTHICVGILTSIGSDNGLSPGRRQVIIWTNAGILLIEPLETNFSEILIRIPAFSFKKMHLKMSSANWRPFFLGLNVLNFFFMFLFQMRPSYIPLQNHRLYTHVPTCPWKHLGFLWSETCKWQDLGPLFLAKMNSESLEMCADNFKGEIWKQN